jgi:hypothetical protein
MGHSSVSPIRSQWQKAHESPKAIGRPRFISEKSYRRIQNMIITGYSERKPVTYFEIVNALQERCRTVLSSDTLWHIIRTMPGVKPMIGVPMKSERVAVDPEEINR